MIRAGRWIILLYLILMLSSCSILDQQRTKPAPTDISSQQKASAAEHQNSDSSAAPKKDTPPLDRPLYEMSLRLDTEEHVISGQETLQFKNASDEPMNDIVLQLYQNTDKRLTEIQKIMLDEEEVSFEYTANKAIIHPKQAISPWEKVKLDIFFTSQIPPVTDKLGDYGYKDGIYALSRFYPSLAVYKDGQWITTPYYYAGDPYISDASDFDVLIAMPPDQKAVFGGHVEYDTVEDNQRLIHVTAKPARTFCFAVSKDYKTVTQQTDGINIIVAYTAGSPKVAEYMLGYAQKALSIFQEKFGPYPYDYLVLAEAPLRSGGMEYSGIALYSPAVMKGKDIEREVVHEIAHQWWFNMVGNDEFREPWLDEGLARYSEVIYYEARYGAARKKQALDLIKKRLNTTEDGVLYAPISDFAKSQYYIVVYDKGALFHDTLRQHIGDDRYFQLLQEYCSRFKWKIATTTDFQKLAIDVTGDRKAIDQLFDQWIYK